MSNSNVIEVSESSVTAQINGRAFGKQVIASDDGSAINKLSIVFGGFTIDNYDGFLYQVFAATEVTRKFVIGDDGTVDLRITFTDYLGLWASPDFINNGREGVPDDISAKTASITVKNFDGSWLYENGDMSGNVSLNMTDAVVGDEEVFSVFWYDYNQADGYANDWRMVKLQSEARDAGGEVVKGTASADAVASNYGDDALIGKAGDDVLKGGKGDDMLFGGTGDDRLFGGKGADTLIGGVGNDMLMGGRGQDVFIFANAAEKSTTIQERGFTYSYEGEGDYGFGKDIIKGYDSGEVLNFLHSAHSDLKISYGDFADDGEANFTISDGDNTVTLEGIRGDTIVNIVDMSGVVMEGAAEDFIATTLDIV